MATRFTKKAAATAATLTTTTTVVGVADHCGWAVLVTAASDGLLIDRRRVELVDHDLPKLPHHHEAQSLPPREVALIERVRASANAHAVHALHALGASMVCPIVGIALRKRPALPATVEECITDYRAQTMADAVMYRDALANAARARGWPVHEYETTRVYDDAARALGVRRKKLETLLTRTGAELGPPWQKDHRAAMAAAIAAQAAPEVMGPEDYRN
jgi:hypothetical protein